MLIPETLFFFIMNNRELAVLPPISKHSVRAKRYWKNRTPEQREAFSKTRSEVQTRVHESMGKRQKNKISKRFSAGMQRYWDNVNQEQKDDHVSKMSAGMKNAWDNADDDFGPKKAHIANLELLNHSMDVERDVPRINDYAGVITPSQMAELNG